MPIKILHLIGQLVRGGAERQLLHLTDALRDRGWDQQVVTFNPGDVWEEPLTRAGIRLSSIPRHPNKLWRLWKLSSIARQVGPAIIHSWSHHTSVYAHWLINCPKPRRIVSFRGNPTIDNVNGKSKPLVSNRRVYAAADCVVSNSLSAIECARTSGVKMRKTALVDNFVIACGRAKPDLDIRVPRIAAAGMLTSLKAYDVLLHALAQLATEGQLFHLALAGIGPERSRLEELTTNLGISSRVDFLGSVEDVPKLFSESHLLVHPSLSEGLSNTVLEAMAEGLPVIASDVGGLSELIKDGQTGVLVPPNQPTVLADRIHRLLENPSLRGHLGRAAFREVSVRFSVERVVAQYERIYRSVLTN